MHEPDEDDDAEFVVPFFCAYEDEFERLRRWILRDSEGQLGRALASAAQKDASIQALRVELAQSQAASEEQRAEIGRLKARVEQLDDSAQYWFNKRDEAVESLDRVREERDQLREERDGLREELRQEKVCKLTLSRKRPSFRTIAKTLKASLLNSGTNSKTSR